jgi:hypothetical protein
MASVTLQLHSLAWVKLGDGIYEPEDAVGAKIIQLYMRREMSANLESYALYQGKHFNQQALPAIVATQSRSLRLAATGRCAFHGSLAGLNRARSFPYCSFSVDFLFHAVSPSLARFSRKRQRRVGV